MKKILFVLAVCVQSAIVFAQPKLVVGIVVDQMRFDYLETFKSGYCDSGFLKLVAQGSSFEEMHYNYVPTFTGPGHASIYTGTTPAIHGIAANDWYDRKLKKEVYCTEDALVSCVGEKNGQGMSPQLLRVPTIGDQLKAMHPNSKVYGIALKDRGGILPAGKLANAAYWYDGKSGCMVSSSYYQKQLPEWVAKFNKQQNGNAYLNTDWHLLLDSKFYLNKTDNLSYEKPFKGEKNPVFPHLISQLKGNSADILKSTPFGNTYTLDFAKELIVHEKLGQDETPDLFCISLSSTDYIGHQFGPQSLEVMDVYLRLDRDIARFISFLDAQVGKHNYTIFLTSDHGAADHPYHLKDSCFYDIKTIFNRLQQASLSVFGKQLFEAESNDQLYIDEKVVEELNMSLESVAKWVEKQLYNESTLAAVAVSGDAPSRGIPHVKSEYIKNGYDKERSGQISLVFRSGCLPEKFRVGGTTHGSCYHYDTHVPFVLYGKNVPQTKVVEPVEITDIAPTISRLLGIAAPQGAIGHNLLK